MKRWQITRTRTDVQFVTAKTAKEALQQVQARPSINWGELEEELEVEEAGR